MDLEKYDKRLFERFGKNYTGGETIFKEDEEAAGIYMVTEGRVRLLKQVRMVERDIVVLKKGDIFGESSMLEEGHYSFSAVALGDCDVLKFKAKDFGELLISQSDVAMKFIKQLIRRLKASEERIENMMLPDSRSKIVNSLRRLARRTKPENGKILLSVSPLEFSSQIGLDVDIVKTGIAKLRKNKYLKITNEKIEIFDIDALEKLFQLIGMKEELGRE